MSTACTVDSPGGVDPPFEFVPRGILVDGVVQGFPPLRIRRESG